MTYLVDCEEDGKVFSVKVLGNLFKKTGWPDNDYRVGTMVFVRTFQSVTVGDAVIPREVDPVRGIIRAIIQ